MHACANEREREREREREEREDAICLSNHEPNILLLAFENIPNQKNFNSEETVCHNSLTLNAISKSPLLDGTKLSFDAIISKLSLLPYA